MAAPKFTLLLKVRIPKFIYNKLIFHLGILETPLRTRSYTADNIDENGVVIQMPTNHLRDVILLTDGAVSNTRSTIQLAKNFQQTNRIFTVGIGRGASTGLFK